MYVCMKGMTLIFTCIVELAHTSAEKKPLSSKALREDRVGCPPLNHNDKHLCMYVCMYVCIL